MLWDKEACFSWKQDLAKTVATYRSEQTLDLGTPGTIYQPPLGGSNPSAEIDIGKGNPLEILIMVTETFTAAGAATLQVKVNMGTGVATNDINAGEITIWDSGLIGKATLVAGYQFRIRTIPPPAKLRYMQLTYQIATDTTLTGKITAGIVNDRQTNMVGL
jgi:hypothetical protein